METYKSIKIYSEADFREGTTITQARQILEGRERDACLIVFGQQLSGVNIGVGQHTREVADIISALLPQETREELAG